MTNEIKNDKKFSSIGELCENIFEILLHCIKEGVITTLYILDKDFNIIDSLTNGWTTEIVEKIEKSLSNDPKDEKDIISIRLSIITDQEHLNIYVNTYSNIMTSEYYLLDDRLFYSKIENLLK